MFRIPQETVDQIIQQADIVEVVGDFVTLKKKGQNMWAPCPFHHEKSPSFSVSPAKGIYKCFGCGKAGNSIQFIMDIEGLGYVDALKYLARKYAIAIEEEVTPELTQAQSEKESQYILSNFAKDYFHDMLLNHEQGKSIGLPYFKDRGLSMPTIQKFELGYSLEAWDGLTSKALAQGFKLEFLESTGLTIVKEDKKYDRFRARVMFPIHNISGRVVGFGGRTLKSNDKTPKYVNSPESEIYHKSDVLYGLYQAKQGIRSQDLCYLVEGYLDVLSLSQGGIENVVASSGTSLTEGQIKLIGRYTKNITVLYDGDAAGIKASLRGIDLILEGGLNVNVVLFPDKEDPDSYIRKVGDTAFKQYINTNAKDFISFKTELLSQEAEHNPVKKAEAIREIISSIAKIPDSIKRAVFLQRCSVIFGIEEQVLLTEYNKLMKQERQKPAAPEMPVNAPNPELTPQPEDKVAADDAILLHHEREVLRLLLNYSAHKLPEGEPFLPYLLTQLEDIEFKIPIYARLVALFQEVAKQAPLVSPDYFINYPDGEIRQEAVSLLTDKFELSENWETHQIFVPRETDMLQFAADTAVLRLKWRNVQQMIKENSELLKTEKDFTEIMKIMTLIKTLQQYEVEIGAQLGVVVVR
ncbi:DNA primase [Adhaeribacter rhizoryzae]|uniref:DNA primase n=1 Tax=Adhaeribacter rhizoryzae TaxID=2607907 RepID=A0A5M6DPL0_9BACT|nr:DNA primase [Adhaeribacter rhizoryzae]KAA5548182.1 DNA primase [Adhaeribacter rhizoryzae]